MDHGDVTGMAQTLEIARIQCDDVMTKLQMRRLFQDSKT